MFGGFGAKLSLLLFVAIGPTVQGQVSRQFLLPDELYQNFTQENPTCSTARSNRVTFKSRCFVSQAQREDYKCRYIERYNCECCGVTNTYFAEETICTRYCLTNNQPECSDKKKMTCCDPIIVMPLNHGRPPMKTSCHGKETVIPDPEFPVRNTVNFPSASPQSDRVPPKRMIIKTTTTTSTTTTTKTPKIESTATTTITKQNKNYDDYDTTLSGWYNDYLRLTHQPTTTPTKSTAQMAAEIREFLTKPQTIDKFRAPELISTTITTTTTTAGAVTTTTLPITLPYVEPIHFPDEADISRSVVRPKPKRDSGRKKNNDVVVEKPVDSNADDYNLFTFSDTYYYPNV